jgi:hypothetical protein
MINLFSSTAINITAKHAVRLSCYPLPRRHLFHSTTIKQDLRPQLKKLFTDSHNNAKPLDTGTGLILGAPAVACFVLYMWKQDTEVLQPIRERQQQQKQQQQQKEQ